MKRISLHRLHDSSRSHHIAMPTTNPLRFITLLLMSVLRSSWKPRFWECSTLFRRATITALVLILHLLTGLNANNTAFSAEQISCQKSSAKPAEKGQPLSHNEFIKQATNGAADSHCINATADGAAITCSLQALTGTLDANGLKMNSSAENEAGTWRVQVTGIGRDTLSPIAPGKVTVDSSLARLMRPELVEEISTSADGVRQDFIILKQPTGNGELRVSLRLDGTTITEVADDYLSFRLASGRQLTWRGLAVTDATGIKLTARFTDTRGTLAMAVNDESAIYPVRIDPTFTDLDWVSMGGVNGVNSEIAAMAWYNLQLCVAGRFQVAGSSLVNSIALWDGNHWMPMGMGVNGVNTIAASGSYLYVGGEFTSAGGSFAKNIAKWDGIKWSALDSEENNGVDGSVYTIAISGSEELFVGGDFINAGGILVNHIAKWSDKNKKWSALTSDNEIGVNNTVEDIVILNGNLFVGGWFDSAGGIDVNHIAMWDDKIKKWSKLGSGINGEKVTALAVSGSDLYVGGTFYTAGDVPANNIALWSNGNWLELENQGENGLDNTVNALMVNGSDLYVGGQFTRAGNISVNMIAKWDGEKWWALGSEFNNGVGGDSEGDNSINALAMSGNDLYVGGRFNAAGNSVNHTHNIAKWDSQKWSSLGSNAKNGVNSFITCLATSDTGDLFVAGEFNAAGGVQANHIAKWNGSVWSTLGLDSNNGVTNYDIFGFNNSYIYSIAVSGSNIYVGGIFSLAGGQSANNIAKWDDNSKNWSALIENEGNGVTFINDQGNDATVTALSISKSNELFVGGRFSIAGYKNANNIAKWDDKNKKWSALNEDGKNGVSYNDEYGDVGQVYALTTSDSGDTYVGGRFNTAGNTIVNSIAKWDDKNSKWLALEEGTTNGVYLYDYDRAEIGTVYSLAMMGTNNLFVGGEFNAAGEKWINSIAKWDETNKNWSLLEHNNKNGVGWNDSSDDFHTGSVTALVVSGKNIYVGGDFGFAGDISANHIARWDENEKIWTTLGSGINEVNDYFNIKALAISNNNLYVGGWFTTAGSLVSPNLALAALKGLISVNDTELVVSETGTSQTCTVTLPLAPAPGTSVVVTLTATQTDKITASGEVTVSVPSITFTHDDWAPKTFTIAGVNDTMSDGDQKSLIILSEAISDDSRFAGYKPDNVQVITTDDEPSLHIIDPQTNNTDLATLNSKEDFAPFTIELKNIRSGDGALIKSISATSTNSAFLPNPLVTFTSPTTTADATTGSLSLKSSANKNTKNFKEPLQILLTITKTNNISVIYPINVTIEAVNDAPVLGDADLLTIGTQGHPLDPVTVTQTNPDNKVAELIVHLIADADDTDDDKEVPRGIAVIGTSSSGPGTWSFSMNDGGSWNSILDPSDAHALLLGDVTDVKKVRVRFSPTGQWIGDAYILYRAWDHSSGNNGDYAIIKANADTIIGDTSAFSAAIATSTIHVNNVIAPIVTMNSGSVTWTEGSPAIAIDNGSGEPATITNINSSTFENGHLTVTIDRACAGDRLEIPTGVSIPGTVSGGIYIEDPDTTKSHFENLVVTFNSSATPSTIQTLLRTITYRNMGDNPAADAEIPEHRTVTVTITVTVNGKIETSAPATRDLIVDPIDDAPTIEPLTLTLVPGLTVTGQLVAHDPEEKPLTFDADSLAVIILTGITSTPGHPVTITSTSSIASKGEVTISESGLVTYKNTLLDGIDDSFPVSVSANGKKATATVTIRITDPNAASAKSFTSVPPMHGQGGKEISYTPSVIGLKAGFTFSFPEKQQPQIASTHETLKEDQYHLDPLTGTLTITLPIKPEGDYLRCGILATDSDHNSAYQQILIKITSADNG